MTMFRPAEAATSPIAVFVSPAARSTERKAKKRNVKGMAAKMTSMYATERSKTAPRAPTRYTSGSRPA
jgi:hypothetical protein